MTKPTQAQTEAAAKAMRDNSSHWDNYELLAKLALTAAAQVGEPVVTGKSGYEYVSTHDEIVAHTIESFARAMTEPTQAQIEAALNAYGDVLNMPHAVGYVEAMKAALTAAAQVGPQANLGTTANTSLPMKEIKQYEQMISRNKVQSERDTATIERCAQVAEGIRNCDYQSMLKIAAAIRKLKDAP